ncbi:phosphorylcholine transferase LicD [Nocardioides sp.]|uniref:LicD family protein n=1 Tax=Nocardioides sp. TaxID=35761 RepID=UPI00356732AA
MSEMRRVDQAGVAAIQDKVRDLLVELDRVATAAEIRYYLAYGTAIGAARDGDLIPWDVDADVWLPHDQYDAFLNRAVPLLGPDYELLTAETHSDYEYLFPRLVFTSIHHVFVRVDVFPLDPAPRSRRLATLYVQFMHLLGQVFFVKRARTDVRAHYSRGKRILTRLLRLVASPVPDRVLLRLFRRLQATGSGRSGLLANSCGSYGGREVFEPAWFARSTTLPIGAAALPVPGEVDEVLSQIYGDYLTPVGQAQRRAELEHATETFVEPLRELGILPPASSPASSPASPPATPPGEVS